LRKHDQRTLTGGNVLLLESRAPATKMPTN
jgi:hypothetical protein